MAIPAIKSIEDKGGIVTVAISSEHHPILSIFKLNLTDNLPIELIPEMINPILPDIDGHITDWWLDILNVAPERYIPVVDDSYPNLPKEYVVLSMDSRNPHKRIPVTVWTEIINSIDSPIVVISPPDQMDYVNSILSVQSKEVINFAGQDTPATVPSILNKATAVVTTDTAISHLSDALGKYTITLFSGSDPEKFKPYWSPHVAKTSRDVIRYIKEVI